jgi:hypothetical protein
VCPAQRSRAIEADGVCCRAIRRRISGWDAAVSAASPSSGETRSATNGTRTLVSSLHRECFDICDTERRPCGAARRPDARSARWRQHRDIELTA